jgi:hypothetical protein
MSVIASLETAAVWCRELRRQVPKRIDPELGWRRLESEHILACLSEALFACSLLTVLLYLLQPGVVLIADEQDDLAKLLSLNKQFIELYQAGKFKEAIPIA